MNLPLRSAALWLAVTGGAAAAAGQDSWVYFGTYPGTGSKGIYVARLDAGGRLTAPALAATSPNPSFLAVDRERGHLYAVNEINDYAGGPSGAVSAFAADARTGRLTALNRQSTVTAGPAHVSVDATGRVVMVANYGGGSVASFPVNLDGSLGAAASSIRMHGSSVNPVRQREPHAHCVLADPANRFALLCDLGLDQVLVFRLDPAAGTLTPNDPPFARIRPGSGPRHLAFRPDGRFVYVISEMACSMTVFAYDAAQGTLAEVQTLSTLPPGGKVGKNHSGAEVVVDPSGRFLYGSNRGHDSIVVYAIDASTGKLTLVEHVPSGGRTPRNIALDPGGRFLLSANEGSGNVVVFRLDEKTGRLTPTGSSVQVGRPVCVAFMPVR